MGVVAAALLLLFFGGLAMETWNSVHRSDEQIQAERAAVAAYRQAQFEKAVDRCFGDAIVLPKAKLVRLQVTTGLCNHDGFDRSNIVEVALNRLVQVHHPVATNYTCFDGWPTNHCEYQLHLPPDKLAN